MVNKNIFLKEKIKILKDEKDIKEKKILLNLKLKKRNLKKSESALNKLYHFGDNLIQKFDLLEEDILSTQNILNKLKEDKIKLKTQKIFLKKSILKFEKLMSRDEKMIKLLEEKLRIAR